MRLEAEPLAQLARLAARDVELGPARVGQLQAQPLRRDPAHARHLAQVDEVGAVDAREAARRQLLLELSERRRAEVRRGRRCARGCSRRRPARSAPGRSRAARCRPPTRPAPSRPAGRARPSVRGDAPRRARAGRGRPASRDSRTPRRRTRRPRSARARSRRPRPAGRCAHARAVPPRRRSGPASRRRGRRRPARGRARGRAPPARWPASPTTCTSAMAVEQIAQLRPRRRLVVHEQRADHRATGTSSRTTVPNGNERSRTRSP